MDALQWNLRSLPMETLECRSPRRCPTCEHWLANGCELERQLTAALAPRPMPVVLARPAQLAAT